MHASSFAELVTMAGSLRGGFGAAVADFAAPMPS